MTGVWNYLAIDHRVATTSWNVSFGIKMICVVISGLGAYMHVRASSPQAKGAFAGIGMAGTIAALVLGVALSS